MWVKQCHKPCPSHQHEFIGGMVTIPKWVVYGIVVPTLIDFVPNGQYGSIWTMYGNFTYGISQIDIFPSPYYSTYIKYQKLGSKLNVGKFQTDQFDF